MPDTFGKIMRDAVEGRDSTYIIERDDGFIRHTSGHQYIAPLDKWVEGERLAVTEMIGPVLDVGCGVGRVEDYVKSQGMEYVGIDLSPIAIEMCRQRGHQNVHIMSADNIELNRSDFKTVVLFGNNFGLMETKDVVVRMLKGFHKLTTDDAKVLASSIDPEDTDDKVHLKYHAQNRAEGRPPGQVKLRNKYMGEVDEWWNLLLCGKELISELAEQAGWYLDKTIGGTHVRGTNVTRYYMGVLRKRV